MPLPHAVAGQPVAGKANRYFVCGQEASAQHGQVKPIIEVSKETHISGKRLFSAEARVDFEMRL
jgi:hypothetical protein